MMTKDTETENGRVVHMEYWLQRNYVAIFLRHNQTKHYPTEKGLQSWIVVWIAKQLLFSLALVDVG